jgi:3-methyl-2-oxobutanoate hydroxymethyltransferase
MSVQKEIKRVTTKTVQEMKRKGEKVSMLTAYDFSMAKMVDEAGVDVILVGDSASNVMAGHETTLPITLDQMIVEMVANDLDRARQHALLHKHGYSVAVGKEN